MQLIIKIICNLIIVNNNFNDKIILITIVELLILVMIMMMMVMIIKIVILSIIVVVILIMITKNYDNNRINSGKNNMNKKTVTTIKNITMIIVSCFFQIVHGLLKI